MCSPISDVAARGVANVVLVGCSHLVEQDWQRVLPSEEVCLEMSEHALRNILTAAGRLQPRSGRGKSGGESKAYLVRTLFAKVRTSKCG